MILLVVFAFLAGIVTILSPCILPVLPIVLSTSVAGKPDDKSRPWGVVTGFTLSFTFFTLFLSSLVKVLGIPTDALRIISVIVIGFFGFSLLIPQFQLMIEQLFTRLTSFLPQSKTRPGYGGGFLIGLSLGLLWTPCVGPILASVIALAVTGTVTLDATLITLVYALGTAIPMFLVIQGGQTVLSKVPWLLKNTVKIQKIFGVLMIALAIGIYFNVDRTFQTWVLNQFPSYGTGLTKIEDNALVKDQLSNLNSVPTTESMGMAPELVLGGQWFNSAPLTLKDLRGKVVLLDFWTYSCINCQRTFPYLKDWYAKYKDKGLVIIGVHSPEFTFEHDAKNVALAIKDFGITYPVMQDNNFATWKAYNNQYWPAEYAIDKNGVIRHTHFGEGDYDGSEKVIQDLLKETGATVDNPINNPASKIYANSPESYLGYARLNNLSSPENVVQDKISGYTFPRSLDANTMAYGGNWLVASEYASPQAGAELEFNFNAKSVYLVMKNTGKPAVVKVFLDDTLTNTITVDADKLYTLVDMPSPGAHLLRLEYQDSNAQVYAFTFG